MDPFCGTYYYYFFLFSFLFFLAAEPIFYFLIHREAAPEPNFVLALGLTPKKRFVEEEGGGEGKGTGREEEECDG